MKLVLWRVGAWLLVSALFAGCGGTPTADTSKPPDLNVASEKGTEQQPPPVKEPPLAELLKLPRAELAQRCDDLHGTLKTWQQQYRRNEIRYLLDENLRVPFALPVWREAKYSADAGFSLPPYCTPGTKDDMLALHLARHGDDDAARKLCTGDAEVLKQLDQLKLGKSYPLEWTRLVALLQHRAIVKLARSEYEGGEELLALQGQLRAALDERAQLGQLGAVLLPRGVLAVQTAAEVLEKAKSDRAAHFRQGRNQWPSVHPLVPACDARSTRTQVEALFATPAKGRCLVAEVTLRALDLLGLPLPEENVAAVVANFDARDRLAELLILYEPRTQEEYPRPSQLGIWLEESTLLIKTDAPLGPREPPVQEGMSRRYFTLDGPACEILIPGQHHLLGGIVQINTANQSDSPPPLPRDYGLLHLARSYEQNRQRFAPAAEQPVPAALNVEDTKVLEQVKCPRAGLPLQSITLSAEKGHLATAGVMLHHNWAARPQTSLASILAPLWAVGGAAKIIAVQGQPTFLWEDGSTHMVLGLPARKDTTPDLQLYPRPGTPPAERDTAAQQFDRDERAQRLAKQTPLSALPRAQSKVKLGMSKAEALAALPSDAKTLKREQGDDIVVTFAGDEGEVPYMLRELVVRLDKGGKVAELRGRYVNNKSTVNELLAEVSKNAWTVPASKQPDRADDMGKEEPLYQWLDDITEARIVHGSAGLEMTLRERPPQANAGVALLPLQQLPRGPEKCLLGTGKDDLYKAWDKKNIIENKDYLQINAPADNPYKVLMVWLEKDKVVRVLAWHREPADLKEPGAAGGALLAAWAQKMRVFGWPYRQDLDKDVLQLCGSHDDAVRVRMFWQAGGEAKALRLWTEWKELPAAAVVSKSPS